MLLRYRLSGPKDRSRANAENNGPSIGYSEGVARLSLFICLFASIAYGQTIVAFGDSLTAGYGVESGFSYPDYLQKELGPKYHVMNLGVSGNTSGEGLARIGAVTKLKPEIVIVEFGGNDGLR